MVNAPLLHASVAVSDIDRAQAFFERALGFRTVLRADDLTDEVGRLTRRVGLTVKLAQLERSGDGCQIELIAFDDNGDVPASAGDAIPLAHLCFAVANLDEAIASAGNEGAELMGEIVTFPEGRCAYLRVPGGAAIEFEEVLPADGTARTPSDAERVSHGQS